MPIISGFHNHDAIHTVPFAPSLRKANPDLAYQSQASALLGGSLSCGVESLFSDYRTRITHWRMKRRCAVILRARLLFCFKMDELCRLSPQPVLLIICLLTRRVHHGENYACDSKGALCSTGWIHRAGTAVDSSLESISTRSTLQLLR